MAIATRTTHLYSPQTPSLFAFGAVASLAYKLKFGDVVVEPAVRGALYEPISVFDGAGLVDVTAGVNVLPWKDVPVRFQLNGTLRIERASRSAANDLVEAVAQANF